MGTGYVPRLLCWMLLGLGVLVLVQGLRDNGGALVAGRRRWRALMLRCRSRSWCSRCSIERLGLVAGDRRC